MTTKATPLSAVSTTREESSLRVLMASFSCLVMLRRQPIGFLVTSPSQWCFLPSPSHDSSTESDHNTRVEHQSPEGQGGDPHQTARPHSTEILVRCLFLIAFDNLLGAKPKHPRVGELSVAPSVEEVAPPTQIPGINLTPIQQYWEF